MPSGQTADFIVVGGGIVGVSVAYNLAQMGAKKVVLLERGDINSGGTAKSCAIVRTHYSIKANLIHAVESLKIFANFPDIVGGDAGFKKTGYMILGPEEHRQPMEAVFRAQNEHDIDTRILNKEEAIELHPLLQVDDVGVIGFDSQTGYCDPHLVTTSYANRAKELGVTVLTDTPVTGIKQNGAVKTIETPKGNFQSPAVVIAAGPWVHNFTPMLSVEFPVEVSRHKVITLKINQPYQQSWPIIKDLTTPDKLYFRPETGGVVLIGTGDHGDPIENPDCLTDNVDMAHVERIGTLMAHRMPAFAEAQYTAGWTGPYDITPDWNPLVGPIPGHEGLFIATGFSGHGFKLAPTIGEGLAQLVMGQTPRVPIDMYDMSRFSRGKTLHGAYGIGSIS
jgi:sarcosine oxidase subunit beta